MQIARAIIIAAVLGVGAAQAQDILTPIQDMVDELRGKPAAKPAQRAAPSKPEPAMDEPAAGEEEPPVPRPRPPSLPDAPSVTPPERPAPPEQAEPPPEQEPELEPAAEPEPEPAAETAPPAAPEPEPEPERVYQAACPAVIAGLVEAQMVAPLSEGACGEQSPLEITAVLSRGRMVPLSSPVITNCQMASALPGWVADVDGYAQAMLESPLASITTGTSYMCRPRNSTESQFTSEHGFANAVDVVGFTLEDGRTIAVQTNWMPPQGHEGRLLRLAHDAACGSFMTVLGPEANAEHKDHLHLDMGCHGQSCQARICQ